MLDDAAKRDSDVADAEDTVVIVETFFSPEAESVLTAVDFLLAMLFLEELSDQLFFASAADSVLLALAFLSTALNSSAEIFLSLELTVSCIRWALMAEFRMFSSLLDLLAVSNFWMTSEAFKEVSSIPLTSVTSCDAVVSDAVVVVAVVAELLELDICIIEEPWVTKLELAELARVAVEDTEQADVDTLDNLAEDEEAVEEATLIPSSVSCFKEEHPFDLGLGATGGGDAFFCLFLESLSVPSLTLIGVLLSDIVFAPSFGSSFDADTSFLRGQFVVDLCLLVAVGFVTLFADLSSPSAPLETSFFVKSFPFTSPLIADFFFTEFDRLTMGKLGSFSTTFLWPGPTEDFLDLTFVSDSADDSRILLGDGDLSLMLRPGEGLLDLRST